MRNVIVLSACMLCLLPASLAFSESAAIADFRIEFELSKRGADLPFVVRCLRGCDWTEQALACLEVEGKSKCRAAIAGRMAALSHPTAPVPVRPVSGSVCLGVAVVTAEIEAVEGSRLQERESVRRGVVVTNILPGSPAERAGFEVGDVITSFKTTTIGKSRDVFDAVHAGAAGEAFDVMLERKGIPMQFNGNLGVATTARGCAPADQFVGVTPVTADELSEQAKPLPFKIAFEVPGEEIEIECSTGCAWGGISTGCPKGVEFGPAGPEVVEMCSLAIDENGIADAVESD